jgi:hypothetical protein
MSIPILCRAGSAARLNASTSADNFARPENLAARSEIAALVAGEFLCAHSTASFYGIVSSRKRTDTPLRDGGSRFVPIRT